MSSLQESSKPHRGEAHENNLLRLFKIDAPRHRINIFGGTISRDTRQSNRDQAKHKPASAQGNRAVTSGGEQNMNGVANKQGQPVTSALGTGPDQSENDEISRSASLEVSQGPITNAPETHTESAGPSRSPTSQAPFTAPPPINPHNLTQQAPHQQSAISNTDGLFFALPTMKMSSHDVYQCSQIEGRLRDAITHKFVPKKGLDPFYSLGSMMVKPKGHSPKAMIVLTCCNRENMKRLKRIVKSLQNFDIEQEGPMSKYKVLVHVGERPDQPAGGNVISSSSHMVYAFIGENVATLSGVLAHTENHSEGGLKKFTIGGTIVVDGVPYALAVAHPFQRQHVEDPPEDSGDGGNDLSRLESDRSEDESSNADGSDYYHSLLASFGPDDNTEDLQSSPTTTGMPASDYFSLKGKQSSNDNIKTEDPDQSTVVQIGVVHLLSEPRSSVQNLERSSTKDPDYALIRLHPTQHSKPNLVTLPEERIPKEITGFLSNIDKATSADVWVNAGMSGIQKGWLTQGTVFLDYGYTCYEARRILLHEPLVPGDSGSWVILTDGLWLCGHIVAAQASSSWAYMVSFEDISNNIAIAMQADDIRLPKLSVSDSIITAMPDKNEPSTFNESTLRESSELPLNKSTTSHGTMQNVLERNIYQSDQYPKSLVRLPRLHHQNRREKHFQYLEDNRLLLFSGSRVESEIRLLEKEDVGTIEIANIITTIGQLIAHLNRSREDPLVRHSIIEWSKIGPGHRMACSADMFKYLLTFHQVDDSFLDMVYTSGHRYRAPDMCLCPTNFSADNTVLYREEEILWLPQRGLSGRELHVSYLLRSVAREDSNQKVSNWSILPTAVYHSFDLRTGRSFWLTTKYDDLFSRRATGMRDSTMDREKGPTRNGKIPACLRAALATHLVYLAWSGENWREFTNDHELLIRKSLLLPRTIEKQPSVGTWSRLKAALNLIRGSAMQHRENADIDDGEWNRALYETSRRIKWALLTIRQDCGTIAQVSEFYIDLTSGAFQSSAQECQDIIDDFASQTKAILKDLETRYVELEYLGKEIDEGVCWHDRYLQRQKAS